MSKRAAKVPAPITPKEVAVNLRVTSELHPTLELPVGLIAAEVGQFEEQAAKAVLVAERLPAENEEQIGRILDIQRAVTSQIKCVEIARKAKTAVLDKLKRQITGYYDKPALDYQRASTILAAAIRKWRQAEAIRLTAEAEKDRAYRKALAEKAAAEQAAEGDFAGAKQILAEQAAMPEPEVKVVATSATGSSLSTRKRVVGVPDGALQLAVSLVGLSGDTRPGRGQVAAAARAALDSASFSKTALNALAKILREAGEEIPGLAISEVETDVVL